MRAHFVQLGRNGLPASGNSVGSRLEDLRPPRRDPTGRSGEAETTGYARLRAASIAPSSQMLCLRVSGITKMAIRNMTAGTTMG